LFCFVLFCFVLFCLFCFVLSEENRSFAKTGSGQTNIKTADIAQNNSGVFGLLAGGAIALGAALEACDAIVDLWVPGQEAGSGLVSQLNHRPLSSFRFHQQLCLPRQAPDSVRNGVAKRAPVVTG
jgi:hypothetical protein